MIRHAFSWLMRGFFGRLPQRCPGCGKRTCLWGPE